MAAPRDCSAHWVALLLFRVYLCLSSGVEALHVLPGPVANAQNADGLSIAQEVLVGALSSSPNYTVQVGDSLETIASHLGTTVACLEGANPQVTDGSVLCTGESLNIPNSNTTFSYAACPGDTFSSLAKQFGVSLASLQRENPYVSSRKVDQVITVPNVCAPTTQSDLFSCGAAFYQLNAVRLSLRAS
jgi:LysM repeat protein